MYSALQLLDRVNACISGLDIVHSPENLYAPVEYVLSLGGKRIRPVLMLLGYYYPIIERINDFVKFNNLAQNILILGIFGVGVLVGIVLISKMLEILFEKYNTKT